MQFNNICLIEDIPTAVHYPTPLNRQPAVEDAQSYLPVSEHAAEHVMSLPMGPYLTNYDQRIIIDQLINAITGSQ